MASLEILKHALRQHVMSSDSSTIVQPLSDAQYSVGFELLLRSSIENTYKQFITPQLSRLLFSVATGDERVSVLEIGPGPESVLGLLPGHLRRKIHNYRAFEPNKLFAERLKKWLCVDSFGKCPLPCLDAAPVIHEEAFTPHISTATIPNGSQQDTQYDIILFCHSMYGMKPHYDYMQKALEVLSYRDKSMVIVFHRDIPLDFGELVCQQRSSFPTGTVTIEDRDEVLDTFSAFIAGHGIQDAAFGESTRAEWRNICRTLAHTKQVKPNCLSFSSPNIMIAFGRSATSLPELIKMVPLIKGEPRVKNREALFNGSAAIVQPTEVRHLQHCVQWALKHRLSVTIIGGGHSGQCLQPSTVAVDMSAFNDIHLILASDMPPTTAAPIDTGLVVVGAGCRVGDIIHATMAAGVTVPLGARPSVGAGSWLQGGIGHLARLHGLSSDAIVGAAMVSVENGQLLCVGTVPTQHAPADAVHPDNHDELLWMLKGAGTNCGIVVSLVFKLAPARMYLVRNWIIPLSDAQQARQRLSHFDTSIAQDLPEDCAADAYIFCVEDQLQLGITLYETTTRKTPSEAITNTSSLGPEQSRHFVDSIGVFDTEMYVSAMHGGHGGGKTSAFKRCMFLKEIGAVHVADILISALQNRPSPLCYVHLLQGGGMVRNVAPSATAFGCRDWDFACVITGVWPRDQDGTALAQTVVDWVYAVAENLLPVSSGAYGADLGPDPRDVSLALTSFGPNRIRLARLKSRLDPNHILAYTCPVIELQMGQKLIFLISGDVGAGKDHCTDIWASMLTSASGLSPYAVRTVSISAATKSEYAVAVKADLHRLLWDRAYKEQHRPALTVFLRDQLQKRPCLFKEHFLEVVRDAADATVLLVTGMRDEAPVAMLGHLLPERRIIEVRVEASRETRQARRGYPKSPGQEDPQSPTILTYRPSLTFDNNAQGDQAAVDFAHRHLFPYVGEDLQRLRDMVRTATDFPKPGVVFQHILGICEQRSGLQLCTSIFQNLFAGNWAQVDAIVSCETGGFIFASALAAQVNIPLVLIRETGKLPPPTVSCVTSRSHISSLSATDEKRLEMAAGVLREGASVVVVDDTFATGATLLAMLKLLEKAGVALDDISAMVVAELPVHRGREFLHQRGFGRISLQSLLVFGGV